jgi:hypothetical protein
MDRIEANSQVVATTAPCATEFIRVVFGDVTTVGRGTRMVDLIAVERVINDPDPDTLASLTRYEVAYAARVLIEHGVSRLETAARLGITDRTVLRWQQHGWEPVGSCTAQVLYGRASRARVALAVVALLPALACMPGPVEDDRKEISDRVKELNKQSSGGGRR